MNVDVVDRRRATAVGTEDDGHDHHLGIEADQQVGLDNEVAVVVVVTMAKPWPRRRRHHIIVVLQLLLLLLLQPDQDQEVVGKGEIP
jgi:hypothetical protein